jgi:putative membrane-bound dehydrogenase-like protein
MRPNRIPVTTLIEAKSFLCLVLALGVPSDLWSQSFAVSDTFQPIDTQVTGKPSSPAEAEAALSVPAGFVVHQIASEPAVRQPIAMTQDDRGRLWVAESYSYDGSDFTEEKRDRIVIFEDLDLDGIMETRKVFHDHLGRLTGLVWGFGGVWIASAPYVAFIPDRDGDDQPDSEPVIKLDGWSLQAEHNSVNGLTWGPDGWLYGRHGIKSPSRPGKPGTPLEQRPEISCSIWRFHPVDSRFEVVSEGTVNPWGLDFNATGQLFITSSVVDHLWHVVPGARFERAPVTSGASGYYELMESTTDHSHRPVSQSTGVGFKNDGGGGHSHADLMIYQGGRWPETYRGQLFITNIMGRRVNQDLLAQNEISGRFVARHGNDFLKSNDEWFRGLGIQYGPDGDVLLTDWCDQGECHDRDGVSRTTGRLYKISWGAPRYVEANLEAVDDLKLVSFQTHSNEWFARHSRRLLQERAAAGIEMQNVSQALFDLYTKEGNIVYRLRALWSLHVINALTPDWLVSQLDQESEDIRYWVIRLLIDGGNPATDFGQKLVRRAEIEKAWLPRMALASALPDVAPETRFELGKALAQRIQATDDPNLARLTWAGWEPAVAERPEETLTLVSNLSSPRLRRWVSRRLAEMADQRPELTSGILTMLANRPAWEGVTDVLNGIAEGLPVADQVNPPNSLRTALRQLYQHPELQCRLQAICLGAQLKDVVAVDLGRDWLRNEKGSKEQREILIEIIANAKPVGFAKELLAMASSKEFAVPAIRALSAFPESAVARELLERYPNLGKGAKAAVVKTLITRPEWIKLLLKEITIGRIPKDAITQPQVRDLAASSDVSTMQQIEQIWGSFNPTPESIMARQQELKLILKDQHFMAEANLGAGRELFAERCQSCHTLFDEGGKLAPDLTGSNRQDRNYLLMNVLDPNAYVLGDWRLTIVTLNDGRILSGSVQAERDSQIDLKTVDGLVTLDRSTILSIQRLDNSIMPTGLTDDLTVHQIRDLFAFLMTEPY